MATSQSVITHKEELRERVVRAKALFFIASGLAFLLSIYLYFSGDKMNGIFVGLWVPSILSAGNMVLKGNLDG